MSSDYDNDLLREGILCFKAGDFDSARDYLERALSVADDNDTRARANFYLSQLIDDPVRKRAYLVETLAADMNNIEARRALARLDLQLRGEAIVDPDLPPSAAPATVQVTSERYPCPKCGGQMTYAPDGHSLVCEYCQRTELLEAKSPGGEEDFFLAMLNGLGQRKPVSMVTFQCQGCGALFLLAPQAISATCAYCGSAHVVATQERRDLLEPDAILPMTLNQDQATRQMIRWVEGNKIQPQGKVLEPRGLYLPVWAFDMSGSISWKGTSIKSPQERSAPIGLSLMDNAWKEPVSGEQPVKIGSVGVPGTHRLADLLVKTMPDFDFQAAPAYDPRFLSGWPAEIYSISMADASLDARRITVDETRQEIQKNGRIQDLAYSSSTLAVTGFQLILVPVWVTEYSFNSKLFRILINAQKGQVVGETPRHGLVGWLNNLTGGSQP